METPMSAIEMTGTVNENNQLQLDGSLPIKGPKRVRVIVLSMTQEEINESKWLQGASYNPAFDFLNDPEEDIYTMNDGKPFRGEE